MQTVSGVTVSGVGGVTVSGVGGGTVSGVGGHRLQPSSARGELSQP